MKNCEGINCRLAYSMTINKAQFDKVGIHLPAPVFSHGILYVAFSRARSLNDISVTINDTSTQGQFKKCFIIQNIAIASYSVQGSTLAILYLHS